MYSIQAICEAKVVQEQKTTRDVVMMSQVLGKTISQFSYDVSALLQSLLLRSAALQEP